jgi:MFS family permease
MGDYVENTTKKGWLTAILELGAWLGAVLSGAIAELCSRKYGILIATTVFMLGVIIQATAVEAGHDSILAGRFITYEALEASLVPLLTDCPVVWELVVSRPSSLFTTLNVLLRKSKALISPPHL